jgi:hypothetical protein
MKTLAGAVLLALAAALAAPVQAQEGLSTSLKLRGGLVRGDINTYTRGSRTEGLGVEVAYTQGKGTFFAEATFDLFNGYRREVTQFGNAWYAGDASQDPWNPSAPSQTYNGHQLVTDPSSSLHAEMLEYQGFGLRLGYRAPITASWMQGWDWQAGISLDRRECRHEVMMTLTPGYWDNTGGDPVFATIPGNLTHLDTDYYEGARFTHFTYKLNPGAFVGVSHAFNDIFRTEINARYTTFNTPHYEPFTYTGRVPSISNTTRNGLVLEVAIGIAL